MKKTKIKSTCSQVIRDKNGRFPKGVSGNPKGNSKFTSVVPLLEALERKGEKKGKHFWDMVADKCWRSKNDAVLIAVLKKLVPDKVDLGFADYSNEKYKECSGRDLIDKANALTKKLTNKL
jgi:hypothetical protein